MPDKRRTSFAYLVITAGIALAGLLGLRRRRQTRQVPSRSDTIGAGVDSVDLSTSNRSSGEEADRAGQLRAGVPVYEYSGSFDQTDGQPDSARAARLLHGLILVGILLVGSYFRFAGLNWDESQHLHPDERFLTQVLTAVQIPKSLGEYFDATESSLNPRNRGYGFFVYGDFPIILTRFVAEAVTDLCMPAPDAPVDAVTGRPAPTWFDSWMRGLGFDVFCYRPDGSFRPLTGYDEVALVGRVMSALFDLGTLVWLFLTARQLYGTRTGLFATALGALAVLNIQQAHFFTADSFATFFVVAAFYFMTRAAKTGLMRHFVAAGLGVGLAMACRINTAPLLGILAIAAFGRAIRDWGKARNSRSVEIALSQIVVGIMAAFVAFRIFMPNAFTGLLATDERWRENMSSISQIVSGEATGPPDVQWTKRTAIIFPWVNMVFWGLGLPLGLAAWAGWAFAAWKLLGSTYRAATSRRIGEWLKALAASRHLMIWVWVTAYFVWQGSQWVKSMRYLLPLYPFMAMFAGWLMASAWAWAQRQAASRGGGLKRVVRAGAYALPIIVVIGACAWAFAFTEIYRQPSTRVAASRWIYENVPSGATLHYADATGPRSVQLELPATTVFEPGTRQVTGFEVLTSGALSGLTFNRLSDAPEADTALDGSASSVLSVKIALDPDGAQLVGEGRVEVARGAPAASYSIDFGGAALEAGRRYYFIGESLEGALLAATSTLVNETWDDGIPMRVDGHDGFSFYRGVDATPYDDDDPSKLGKIIGWVQEADYINLTSNRIYASTSRQLLRYPLTIEYYRLLMSGQLGFDLVAVFESYPRLGSYEFVDQETTQALGLWPDPTRPVNPGVISVPYPPAEEAFSVYDHPRVLIFKKRSDFDMAQVAPRLSGLDLESAYHGFTPKSETASPTGQMLDPQSWAVQQDSGTWSQLFDRRSILNSAPGVGVIVWYGVVALLGWVAFPLLFVAAPGLADRGYGLSRTLGVLLLSFAIWFLASLRILPFTRDAIVLVALALALVSGAMARSRRAEILEFIRRNRRLILVEEAVFAAAFLLFLALRYGNPDLWHPYWGGEKPMDFAYFNAVVRSQYFPPYDPWFSGGFLTYYYYGFVIVATLTKLVGIIPAIAYNIALPMIFGLAAIATFSVAHGLASRFGLRQDRGGMVSEPGRTRGRMAVVAGLIAVVFVMLIGNLGEVKLIVEEVSKIGRTDLNTTIPALKTAVDFGNGLVKLATGQQQIEIGPDRWFWDATRIIPPGAGEPGPITEIPFFTFLYADLHAHMMAMPLTILMLGLAAAWLTGSPGGGQRSDGTFDPHSTKTSRLATRLAENWPDVLSLVLGGLTLGALKAANSADYPTYLGIGVMALVFRTWPAESLQETGTWFRLLLRLGLFFASAQLLFMPFGPSDRLGSTTIDLWQGSRTVLWAYVFVHGIFLLPIATYLWIEMRRWGTRWLATAWRRLAVWRWLVSLPIGLLALAMLGLLLSGISILAVAGPLILLLLGLIIRPRLPVVTRFWMLMVLLAIALSAAVEVVVFKGDIGRMNMVFKFYYQIWVLLGIAGAVVLAWLWQRAEFDMPRLNGGWRITVVVLVVGGLLYPPFAARGKLSIRYNEGDPPGLDGMAYMRRATFSEPVTTDSVQTLELRWDFDAITWMQDNVVGTPVIAEGRSRYEYLWGSRVAIYTGLPTILGWEHHQRQQRGLVVPGSVIDQRKRDVQLLFGEDNLVTTRKILERYGVKYIYVGVLERAYYPATALAKFDRMTAAGELQVAYQNPRTTVYEVVALSP